MLALFHFIIEFIIFYMESSALKIDLVKYVAINLNAKINWIPFIGQFDTEIRTMEI